MKINLLILAILFLVTGTLKVEQPEYRISAKENSSAGKYPQEDNHYCQLTIDHLFVYTNPMVNYKITVSGTIPVHRVENFAVYVKMPTYEFLGWVSTLTGKGKVKVSGSGSINAGSFKVKKINYVSEIDINVHGKTRFLEVEKGTIPLLNLALEEKWSGDLNWDIETSDPKNDRLRLDMFKRMVPTKIPDSPHTGRTIECINGYLYEKQTYEQVSSVPGMGTFRWRYTISDHFVKTYDDLLVKDTRDPKNPAETHHHFAKVEHNPNVTVDPKNDQQDLTDNRPKPKDYVTTYEPRLGPPLESIVWEIVDVNTAPLIR